VRPTSQRSIQQPKRTGTSSAAWVGEVATRVESTNPAYGMVEIPTHEMTAEHYVSFAELEDSVFDVEGELRQEFAEQFAKAEGAAVVSGNGVGKPFGFLSSTALTGAGKYTPSGTAANIAGAAAGNAGQGDSLISLYHAVPTAYAQNGKWALNRVSLGAVRKLKDTTGSYLWQPGVANGMPPTILGSPYVECPDMPDEGSNTFPVAYGDFSRAYEIIDRIAMAVVRDDYTQASKGLVKFVARRRVGGALLLSEAIRLLKCATT
jgi:HK97 family phage major capsid protein